MKIQSLSALILCAASMQAVADKEYWIGTDGEYVLDRNGHCVRTIRWTPEAAIPGVPTGHPTDHPARRGRRQKRWAWRW